MIFVYAMITMGVMATGIATYEVNWISMLGGPLTAYMVFTAMAAAYSRRASSTR